MHKLQWVSEYLSCICIFCISCLRLPVFAALDRPAAMVETINQLI